MIIIFNMFSRFSFNQQRDLESFLGIAPNCSSGPCDKSRNQPPTLDHNTSAEVDTSQREIWYSYRYNPATGDVSYSFP